MHPSESKAMEVANCWESEGTLDRFRGSDSSGIQSNPTESEWGPDASYRM